MVYRKVYSPNSAEIIVWREDSPGVSTYIGLCVGDYQADRMIEDDKETINQSAGERT